MLRGFRDAWSCIAPDAGLGSTYWLDASTEPTDGGSCVFIQAGEGALSRAEPAE